MIIVGLGNIGTEYENTYHNMGFMVVDAIAEKLGKKFDKKDCSSQVIVTSINKQKIVIAKPETYMNLSGQAVKSLLSKYKETPEEGLLVCYDDIDLPKFTIRVRPTGSAGTHNGMRNIISLINTEKFLRVRVGTGRGPGELKNFVLSKINKEDMEHFKENINKMADLIIAYIKDGDVEKFIREGNAIKC